MDKTKSLFSKNAIGDDTLNFDVSVTMSTSEIRQFLDKSNLSVVASPTLFRNVYNNANTTGSIAGSTFTGAEQQSSAKELTEHLYGHFLEVLQSRSDDSEVFDTVQDLIQTCSDTVTELATHRRKVNADAGAPAPDNLWLIHERNTWRLLYCLYKDRLIVQKESNDFDDLPLVGSEKVIVEHLYAGNDNLREYQLIVDWLEQNAYEQATSQIGHYTDRTVAWENTLHQLQQIDRTTYGCRKDVVKVIDPDAPNREKRPLHDLDQDTETRLAKQVCVDVCVWCALSSFFIFSRVSVHLRTDFT